jgi:hypothetical protein
MAKITGSGQRVLAELSQDPVARKNKYDTLKRQFDALERRADYLATRLEANQTRSNQGAYNAILQQLQNAETRINNLATEMNSIAEASRYRAQEDRKQQKIPDRKPKTTMDKVRESLPYQIASSIPQMAVDAYKGVDKTIQYGVNQAMTGKAGTQGSVMNPEDFYMGDVADTYIKELGKNTGTYLDALNSLAYWGATGRIGSKPDSQDERFRNMIGDAVPRVFGTKDIADPTVAKGAELVADPLALIPVAGRVKAGVDAVTDPKLWQGIADNLSRGTRSNAIDVWHGSPHTFDEFKANANLGKGEGAQAFGVGGYTAGSKGVAEYYQQALRKDVSDMDWRDAQGNKITPKDNNMAWEMIDLADGDLSKAKENLVRMYSGNPENTKYINNLTELDGLISSGVRAYSPRKNNLYKIRLAWDDAQKEASMPLSDEHFLDLDSYMEEQPQYILDRLKEGGYELKPDRDEIVAMAEQKLYEDADDWAERTGGDSQDFINSRWGEYVDDMESDVDGVQRDMTGKEFYDRVVRESGYSPQLFEEKTDYARQASDYLYGLGIAGNRYADGSLRKGKSGDYNYVNFSDALAEVIERNGVPVKKKVDK